MKTQISRGSVTTRAAPDEPSSPKGVTSMTPYPNDTREILQQIDSTREKLVERVGSYVLGRDVREILALLRHLTVIVARIEAEANRPTSRQTAGGGRAGDTGPTRSDRAGLTDAQVELVVADAYSRWEPSSGAAFLDLCKAAIRRCDRIR